MQKTKQTATFSGNFTNLFLLCFAVINLASFDIYASDKIFEGQLSAYANYNFSAKMPLRLGARYIPDLSYKINLSENKSFDFEASANIFGNIGIHPFDSAAGEGKIKPYRAWLRYSTSQFELRAGLQKINFGSAMLLRPLMWFDQIDPRDPLQLTDGVWGVLGRYYFLNNANIWLWGLLGNTMARPWDIGASQKSKPEFGARIQSPVPKGEAAISYHYRTADISSYSDDFTESAEQRIGLDGKWDVGPGLWFEAAWINKQKKIAQLTNQEMINLGTDYTFSIGNGLNLTFEHLIFALDETAFKFRKVSNFSGLSLSYPLSILDNASLIIFYDWTGKNAYNFLNLKRQYAAFSIILMLYWNPENYRLPQQSAGSELMTGKGIQLMFVINH